MDQSTETTAENSSMAEGSGQEDPTVCPQGYDHSAASSYKLTDESAYFKGSYFLSGLDCCCCNKAITDNLKNPKSSRKRFKAHHCFGMNVIQSGGTVKTDHQCNHCLHPECYVKMLEAGDITNGNR